MRDIRKYEVLQLADQLVLACARKLTADGLQLTTTGEEPAANGQWEHYVSWMWRPDFPPGFVGNPPALGRD